MSQILAGLCLVECLLVEMMCECKIYSCPSNQSRLQRLLYLTALSGQKATCTEPVRERSFGTQTVGRSEQDLVPMLLAWATADQAAAVLTAMPWSEKPLQLQPL